MKRFSPALIGAIFSFVSTAALAAQASDLIDRAKDAIGQGQAAQAYQLLLPKVDTHISDTDFNFLLGIAAVDQGDLITSVMAFERVLAVDPQHLPAKAELGRVHALLGETDTARVVLEELAAADLPVAVAAQVQAYLDGLARPDVAGNQSNWNAWVEIGVGYDSNVNSATDGATISIPALGGAIGTLAGGSIEQEDEVFTIAAGASFQLPVRKVAGLSVVGSASTRHALHDSQAAFETETFDASLGLRYEASSTDAFTATVNGQEFNVGHDRFRTTVGGQLSWQHLLAANRATTAYLQVSDLHYPGQTVRDAWRYVVGGVYAHALDLSQPTTIFVGAYVGREEEQDSNVAFLGHDLYGVRLGGSRRVSDQWRADVGLSFEARDYGGKEPLFLKGRDDLQTVARIAATYRVSPQLEITPQLSYLRNDSNIALNDHDRTIAMITARYSIN